MASPLIRNPTKRAHTRTTSEAKIKAKNGVAEADF